jgi:hypothetical protein
MILVVVNGLNGIGNRRANDGRGMATDPKVCWLPSCDMGAQHDASAHARIGVSSPWAVWNWHGMCQREGITRKEMP